MRKSLEEMYNERKNLFNRKADVARTEQVRWGSGGSTPQQDSGQGTASGGEEMFITVNAFEKLPADVLGSVNHSGGYASGSTQIDIDNVTGIIHNGDILFFEGEEFPEDGHKVTAHGEDESLLNTVSVTFDPPLSISLTDNHVIHIHYVPRWALVAPVSGGNDVFARIDTSGVRENDWVCVTRLFS